MRNIEYLDRLFWSSRHRGGLLLGSLWVLLALWRLFLRFLGRVFGLLGCSVPL